MDMNIIKDITVFLEKLNPMFSRISGNIYLRAVRDSFITCLPLIILSSLFILTAGLTDLLGGYGEAYVTELLWRAYNFTMGMFSLFMVALISKNLSDSLNVKMPVDNKLNYVSVMVVSEICFLFLATDNLDGYLSMEYLGTKGLITSFFVGFIVPNVYKFFLQREITIKMPKEVPDYIAQVFVDLVPLSVCMLGFWIFSFQFKAITNTMFTPWIMELLMPVFSVADSYVGLAIIYGAMALFWFVGIHGPSVVEPAVATIYMANLEVNMQLAQAGEHVSNLLTYPTSYFIATMGGTGATLMFGLLCAFCSKSKQLKALGRTAIIPSLFAVNEPLLFGAPIVFNPVLFIPFIAAPVLNVWIFKLFVEVLGMNSFYYILPWNTPAPIGLVVGTGADSLSFVLVLVLVVVDVLVYYPFFRFYDKQLLLDEYKNDEAEEVNEKDTMYRIHKMFNYADALDGRVAEWMPNKKAVLVMCALGATSSMLAKSIAVGASSEYRELDVTSIDYGNHRDILHNFDMVILAPQMNFAFDDLKNECDTAGIICVTCSGGEYIEMMNNPKKAIKFVRRYMEI